MKLKEIHRTSTFAWSPAASTPTLVTGTVAGALDENFSNDSKLEIWSPDWTDREEYDLGSEGHPQAKHTITTASRFNRLAWGAIDSARPQGVIASGMENGEINIWDPEKIVAQADAAEATIHNNKAHDGPVRGLDFNPIAKNLLASGATNGQIFVWDLKDPTQPYSPGGRSSRLDEITALSWNSGVQQILATSSSTGFTVVWDLRGKREVVALSYSTGSGPIQSSRKGQSAVAWHPDNSTRLITASEDDASPIIMLWDLRNARAPEKTLSGHDKGILSLSWCKQDADLLLSCGKDSRTIAWNPQSGELIGELPAASNWAYQVEWCPRNPNILATASFDGSVGIHSIQSTNQEAAPPTPHATDDVFAPSYHQGFEVTMSLKQAPKWLKPPVAGSFGYGGLFVRVSNPSGATGQRGLVRLEKVGTETSIISRASALSDASKDPSALTAFAKSKANNATEGDESWKALSSLFNSSSRDELIALLGFSKDKIAERVAKAIKALQANTPTASAKGLPAEGATEDEVVVKTEPEEISLSGTESDVSSLFDNTAGTPQADAAADFISTMGGIPSALPPHMQIPHLDPRKESSAAATLGSPTASGSPSEIMKSNTFDIYPEGETEVDRLVTQAIVLGDFASAVDLCLSAERYADAILLAVRGGPELLQKTQKAYFEKSTSNLPYLRLYQSVVGNDLIDIVQNADLKEWQEIFVILCTYATREEFSSLTEQLGQRLEFKGTIVKNSGADDCEHKAKLLRKNATLCYLAAGNLDKLVNIWVEEMVEEQEGFSEQVDGAPKEASKYTAHAQALQSFIEKVTIFRAAVKYQDVELQNPTTSDSVADSGARTYKLAALYDRYVEYADLLATQGLLDLAVTYVNLTPKDYNGGGGKDSPFHFGRERLLVAAGKQHAPISHSGPGAASKPVAAAPATRAAPAKPPSQPYGVPAYGAAPTAAPSGYTPYGGGSVGNSYAPTGNSYAPAPSNTYGAPAPYGQPAYGGHPPSMVPPPPPAVNTGYTPPASTAPPPPAASAQQPLPAALRRDIPGWNDAPVVARRTPVGQGAVAPITNPLPNSPPVQNYYNPMPGPGSVAPPPRTGSAGIPPPPKAGIPPPPPAGRGATQGIPPPPKAGSVPPHVAAPPFSQPGPGPLGARPGSVGPYDIRPPSADPQSMNRYAPPPRADAGPEPPRGGGLPPPPPMNRGFSPQGQPGSVVPPPPMGGGQYAPPPPMGGGQYAPSPTSMDPSHGPPPSNIPPPPRASGAPPIVRNAAGGPPQAATSPPAPPPAAAAPPKPAGPKYPPGDRSHIPDSVKGVYQILYNALEKFKSIVPKRTADDVERRMNILFDSLNCATLSIPVVQQLLQICDAFQERNPQVALQIHLDMLTQGSRGGDDITSWMPALKQLCQRMLD